MGGQKSVVFLQFSLLNHVSTTSHYFIMLLFKHPYILHLVLCI